ncbi:hypothetical protein [Streptomyces sp. ODS28]|uniref:hypothetical protein n=1 Tax=Streptomyces sp. ODS28 TaxID=3136688 RepID=UPI0031E65F45
MDSESGAARPGTPRGRLGGHLELVARLTERARSDVERDSDATRVFLAGYAGFLTESGAEIRWLLEPSVAEQATVAVRRRTAGDLSDPQLRLAARLLALVWSSGAAAGLTTDDWLRAAPELPDICLRVVRHMAGGPEEGGSAGPEGPGGPGVPGVPGVPGADGSGGAGGSGGTDPPGGAGGPERPPEAPGTPDA